MTYQNNERKAVVRHIQELLRSLQINTEGKATVPVDGIYDSKTAEAVGELQAINGLPVTGEVDRETYDLLYKLSLEAEILNAEPLPLYLFKRGKTVSYGEKSDFVMILQVMLNVLTVAYDDFVPLDLTGKFDIATETAVRRFQMRNAIEPSGTVEKETWNALVRNYNKHNENF